MIGTMFAIFLVLYLAAMRETCKMVCIFGFVLGVKVLIWGGGGRVVLICTNSVLIWAEPAGRRVAKMP